jgi:hypothetical protein
MDKPSEVLRGLQHFRHRNHGGRVPRISIRPRWISDTDTSTFVDLESGERLDRTVEIAKRYRERLEA